MSENYEYQGKELEIFELAQNWKAYLFDAIHPHLRGRVLEVGAGIGAVAQAMCSRLEEGEVEAWLSLEPSESQVAAITDRIKTGNLPAYCSAITGFLAQASDHGPFDTILYNDVLEHIEDDGRELEQAAALLSPGGRLVVLAPAHGWLFSELDRAVGHFRRYTAGSLRAIQPPGVRLVRCDYYDSVGMAASLANRLLLRRGIPTASQISIWDGMMIPLSRRIDPLFGHRMGKSVLAVWQKEST